MEKNILSGEKDDLILQRICDAIPSWSQKNLTLNQVDIKRLSGLSNACYRVSIKKELTFCEPKVVLYRKFECQVIDKNLEAAIFKANSDAGLGPKLIFQNDSYRIETFFYGRPLTIWEMRNPNIMKSFASKIYQFHTCQESVRALTTLYPNKEKAGTEVAIDVWAPQVEAKIARIKTKLNPSKIKGHQTILECLEYLEKEFFFEGY